MRKLLGQISVCVFLVFGGATAEKMPNYEEGEILPKITLEKYHEKNSEILLDASESRTLSPSIFGRASFSWIVEGMRPKFGEQLKISLENPGEYDVRLKIKQGRKSVEKRSSLVVFDREAVWITDEILEENVVEMADQLGVKLVEISVSDESGGLAEEEKFSEIFSGQKNVLKNSEHIFFDGVGISALQSLVKFQKNNLEDLDFSEKSVIVFTENRLDKDTKLLKPYFDLLNPKFILVTRPQALQVVLSSGSDREILDTLESAGPDFRKIDESSRGSWILPLSKIMEFFVFHGISQNLLYLLLSVPIIGFFIAFFRQVIGITTFGVFAPLMLTLSLLVLGIKFGLAVFFVVISVSVLIRYFFEKVELLYIPKISLLFSILALSYFLVLALAVLFDSSLDLTLTIFPMLVISSLSEKFLASHTTSGFKNTFVVMIETLIVILAAYLFVTWELIKSAILVTPELILIFILLTIWLGRFTGLRVSEYFKFRALLREDSQE